MQNEAEIGIRRVSRIRIDHEEDVGAIVAGNRIVVGSLEGDRGFIGGDCRLSAMRLSAKKTSSLTAYAKELCFRDNDRVSIISIRDGELGVVGRLREAEIWWRNGQCWSDAQKQG